MPMPAYVNSGTQDNAVVSANGVSGLTIPMPGSLVVGNWLMAVIGLRPSGTAGVGFSDDDPSVTGSGVWTLLANGGIGGIAGRVQIYGKHCTGGEGNLKVLVTAVAAAGNGLMVGRVHQFSNVKFTGDTSYFEALHVTEYTLSGPIQDAAVQTTGSNRLAGNVIMALQSNSVRTSENPTGETGGKWTLNAYSTGVQPNAALWTAPMAAAGTIDGGAVTVGPAGLNRHTAVGFALAPCGADLTPARKFHHYLMLMGA